MLLHSEPWFETLCVDPTAEVVKCLRCWNDVERRRNSSSFLKVGNPQFASGKLPFCIGFFLKKRLEKELRSQWDTRSKGSDIDTRRGHTQE